MEYKGKQKPNTKQNQEQIVVEKKSFVKKVSFEKPSVKVIEIDSEQKKKDESERTD